MAEAAFESFSLVKKVPTTVSHKISEVKNSNSLVAWATLYFEFHVVGSPTKTVEAKTKDMSKFLTFFEMESARPYR